mgnify:FL=1
MKGLTICELDVSSLRYFEFSLTMISESFTKDHFSAKYFRISAENIVFAHTQTVQISTQVLS